MKKFDYWMLSVADLALQREYDELLKGGNRRSTDSAFSARYGIVLKEVAKVHGMNKAKELQNEWDNNQFHPLGKIALTRQRIQEMKDEYKEALTKKS